MKLWQLARNRDFNLNLLSLKLIAPCSATISLPLVLPFVASSDLKSEVRVINDSVHWSVDEAKVFKQLEQSLSRPCQYSHVVMWEEMGRRWLTWLCSYPEGCKASLEQEVGSLGTDCSFSFPGSATAQQGIVSKRTTFFFLRTKELRQIDDMLPVSQK